MHAGLVLLTCSGGRDSTASRAGPHHTKSIGGGIRMLRPRSRLLPFVALIQFAVDGLAVLVAERKAAGSVAHGSSRRSAARARKPRARSRMNLAAYSKSALPWSGV